MKKIWTILLTVTVLVLTVATGYLFMKSSNLRKETNMLIQQNAQLQNKIDAVGEVSQVWTVLAGVYPGKEIKAEELIEMNIPVASINKNYITSKDELLGKYYKVGIEPGTPLTTDVVMKEEREGTQYERDIVLPYVPLGLRVGDYVDIRIVLPYGEEMIVLERERINKMVGNVIKVSLDEAELHLYTSMLKDQSLYENWGTYIYATKYVEPGLDTETIPYYPVRKQMEGFVMLDPNIPDKGHAINSELRTIVEGRLNAVLEEHRGLLSSGAKKEASKINSSAKEYLDVLNDSNAYSDFDDPDTDVSMDSTDASGNSSMVTDKEKEESKGDALFEDEDVIQ